jgi:hypothetical protein
MKGALLLTPGSILRGVVAVVVVLGVFGAGYLGSYWWLWHTESGRPAHRWLYLSGGRDAAPPMVQAAYWRLYGPARGMEQTWRMASFDRKLSGEWESEDGTVRVRFEGSKRAQMEGMAEVREGIVFDRASIQGSSLVLRSNTAAGVPYVAVPQESLEDGRCVIRIFGKRGLKLRELSLRRPNRSHSNTL